MNKFFYTRNQNSLPTAYQMMLKEKYCSPDGKLYDSYPSYYQFRYYYRKHRKMERFYISRDGIKDYQMNNRPLLGDGVHEYVPNIGTAMLDATICDIYLVKESGQLIGRPVLVLAIDANSSYCVGYSLLWEGGTYSLVQLMLDIYTRQDGVIPGHMITDMGTEYTGCTFGQLTDLGIVIETLPSYRPELKGQVEKAFDLIQSSYKSVLKGKGVIMPDFQKRGAHDYRKDAVLTMNDFSRIIEKCIAYYNEKRIIEKYPYSQEMINAGIAPHACDIWNWKKEEMGSNLLPVSKDDLILTLLPRKIPYPRGHL